MAAYFEKITLKEGMREIPFPEAAKDGHLSPPATTSTLPSPSPPPASRCYVNNNRCSRSSSEEFKANTVLVFVFLFGVLICGLAFHATIHYLCMRRRRMETAEQKVELENAASEQERVIPAVIYSEEMKVAGVGAECVICLSEIAISERIRVLEKCSHGFHAQCIDRWLLSRSSCPTCRTNSQ